MPNLVKIGPTVWISIPDTHTHRFNFIYKILDVGVCYAIKSLINLASRHNYTKQCLPPKKNCNIGFVAKLFKTILCVIYAVLGADIVKKVILPVLSRILLIF